MLCVTEHISDGTVEKAHHSDEYRGQETYYEYSGGEDAMRVFLLLVGEAEECCLHAEGEEDKDKRRIGIEICHHSVSSAVGRGTSR